MKSQPPGLIAPPALVIRSSFVIISLHDMSEYIWSKLYPVPLFLNLTWIPLINVHKLFTKWHALLFIRRPTHPAEKWRDIRVRESKKSFQSGTSIVEKQCNGGWQIVRRKLWCQDYFQRFRVMKDTSFIGLGSDHHTLVTKGQLTHKC